MSFGGGYPSGEEGSLRLALALHVNKSYKDNFTDRADKDINHHQ